MANENFDKSINIIERQLIQMETLIKNIIHTHEEFSSMHQNDNEIILLRKLLLFEEHTRKMLEHAKKGEHNLVEATEETLTKALEKLREAA